MMRDWVRLPTRWIRDGGLKAFRWTGGGGGSDNLAALMVLVPIAHHADPDEGCARVTYDTLGAATGLSRRKISDGLSVLAAQKIVTRQRQGRSTYELVGFDTTGGWGKLPAKKLYIENGLAPFTHFKMRSRVELDAMKLYYLFVERRDTTTNMAKIGYEKIQTYSGVNAGSIRHALSLLGTCGLVDVDRVRSEVADLGIGNRYRLIGLHPRQHAGTTGRSDLASDPFAGIRPE